jgi:hypothetical protein
MIFSPRTPRRHLDRTIPAEMFKPTPLAFVAGGELYVKVPDSPLSLDEGEALARAMLKAIEVARANE